MEDTVTLAAHGGPFDGNEMTAQQSVEYVFYPLYAASIDRSGDRPQMSRDEAVASMGKEGDPVGRWAIYIRAARDFGDGLYHVADITCEQLDAMARVPADELDDWISDLQ